MMQHAFTGDALKITAADWNRVREIANSPQLGLLPNRKQPTAETYYAKTGVTGIPGRVGDTVGSATVTVYELNDSDELVATDIQVTCKNISTASVASDAYIVIAKERKTATFVVLVESCEPPAS